MDKDLDHRMRVLANLLIDRVLDDHQKKQLKKFTTIYIIEMRVWHKHHIDMNNPTYIKAEFRWIQITK